MCVCCAGGRSSARPHRGAAPACGCQGPKGGQLGAAAPTGAAAQGALVSSAHRSCCQHPPAYNWLTLHNATAASIAGPLCPATSPPGVSEVKPLGVVHTSRGVHLLPAGQAHGAVGPGWHAHHQLPTQACPSRPSHHAHTPGRLWQQGERACSLSKQGEPSQCGCTAQKAILSSFLPPATLLMPTRAHEHLPPAAC